MAQRQALPNLPTGGRRGTMPARHCGRAAHEAASPTFILIILLLLVNGAGRAAAEPSPPSAQQPATVQISSDLPARYLEAQATFLREDFQRVAKLVKPLTLGAPSELAMALQMPSQAEHATQLWLWYALSLERLQRQADALRVIDELKRSLSDVPADRAGPVGADGLWAQTLFWEGEISRRAGKLGRAKLAYERLLERFPASSWQPKARLGLGLLMFQERAYEAAFRTAEAVASTQPTTPVGEEALVLQGLCAIRLGKFSEAVVTLQHVAAQPIDPILRMQALLALGEAFDGAGQAEEAVRAYTDAARAAPTASWANAAAFGLGWTYFRHRRCQDSLSAFEAFQARADAPPAIEDVSARTQDDLPLMAWFAKGRCLMELGEEAKAVAAFEALRAADPEHDLAVDAALSLAEVYEHQQRFDAAIEMAQTVLRQAFSPSQRTQALMRWGSVLLAQGDAVQARAKFEEALQTTDAELHQAALNGLGDLEASLGDRAAALQRYDEARQVQPASRGGRYAAYQTARLQLQGGEAEKAIAGFQDVASSADAALAGEARLAMIFAEISQGEIDRAKVDLDEGGEAGWLPQQAARAEYYRALIAMEAGNTDDVKAFCARVIEAAPSSDEALEARLLLLDASTQHAAPDDAVRILQQTWQSAASLPPRSRGRIAQRLAELAVPLGDYGRAIAWYDAAWEALPALRSELEYRLASCYEEAGDVPVAIQRYQAIAQPPWKIRGQLAAAKLLEREERWPDAMALYTDIVQAAVPESKFAQERLAALQEEGMVRNGAATR